MSIIWWRPNVTDIFNAVVQLSREVKNMATQIEQLQAEQATLVANVAAEGKVEAAAALALKGLTDQQAVLIQELKDAVAANDPTVIQAAIDTLEAQNQLIVTNTAALSTAIPATPAA